MKILIAADGSKFTKKMLAYLTTHDDLFSASHQFTVLNVQHSLPPRASAAVGAKVVQGYYQELAEKVLQPIAKFLVRHGIEAQSVSRIGPPGETIARYARSEKFDLVVLGSHGHGALANLVMGSVATQVLAHCSVPVLLVR